MNTPFDNSSEIPVRRSISDPAATPRGEHHQRVGTPYPTRTLTKKKEIPSKIPRLTPQHSQIDTEPHRHPHHPHPHHFHPKQYKEFYPSQHPQVYPEGPSYHNYPITPDESQLDLSQIYQPVSPPVVQIYKKYPKIHHQNHEHNQLNKALVICKGLEKSRPSCSNTSTTSISNQPGLKSKASRHTGFILDPEGYIQGPHTAHNRRIEGKPEHSFPCEQDRGDYANNKGTLPPLPPNVKSKNLKTRLTTATLSQVNTHTHSDNHPHPHQQKIKSHSTGQFGFNLPNSASKNNSGGPAAGRRALINPSATSILSKIHEVGSCTNLHKRLQSESEVTTGTIHNCPLCTQSKGQCHLHHRTMCSRYLTDLEWRICHAVNIYVYKNGEEGQTPVLIHIPPGKKKNMRCVMSIIQERICYPIGYAKHLYRMNGKKVTNPCELEMYNNYVVASNYDKAFKCVCYARRKSPLLVLAKESKHVRELRLKNYQYEIYLAKKRAEIDSIVGNALKAEEERPNCVYGTSNMNTYYACETLGPTHEISLVNCQPGVRASGPICPSKTSSKRKHRTVVVPYIAYTPINCNNGPPPFEQVQSNPLMYELPPNQGPPFLPQRESTRNPWNSFARNVGTPIPPQRPLSRDYGNKDPMVYSVNHCTITTTSLKDPRMEKNDESGRDDLDGEEGSGSGRYKGIINDEESVFYSSKKKKLNRGVIDVIGEKKKIFYRETDVNGNLGESELDEGHNSKYPAFPTQGHNTNQLDKLEKETAVISNQIKTVRLDHHNFSPNKEDPPPSTHPPDLNNNSINEGHRSINGSLLRDHPQNNQGCGEAPPPLPSPVNHGRDNPKDTRIDLTHLDTDPHSKNSNQPAFPALHKPEHSETHHPHKNSGYKHNSNFPTHHGTSEMTYTDEGFMSISAPSRSYTILQRPLANPPQNRHTQVTPLVSTGSGSGQQFLEENSFHSISNHLKNMATDYCENNGNNNENYNKECQYPLNMEQITRFQDPSQFLYNSIPPSLFLSRNQTSYTTCYGHPSHSPATDYFGQGSKIQQIYPVEILNERPPYTQIAMERTNLSSFRPPQEGNLTSYPNCYSADLDIPFTPIYQRSIGMDQVGGSYIQVPPLFMATKLGGLNQQFSFRGDLQGYAGVGPSSVPSGAGGRGMGVKKPSRRNVAIQMGEPISSTRHLNPNPGHMKEVNDPDIPSSPRPPRQIFYMSNPNPGYYCSQENRNNQETGLDGQKLEGFSPGQNQGQGHGQNPNPGEENGERRKEKVKGNQENEEPQERKEGNSNSSGLFVPPPTGYRDFDNLKSLGRRDQGCGGEFEHRSSRVFGRKFNNNFNNWDGWGGREENDMTHQKIQENNSNNTRWRKG